MGATAGLEPAPFLPVLELTRGAVSSVAGSPVADDLQRSTGNR